jgi:hypothetical protein
VIRAGVVVQWALPLVCLAAGFGIARQAVLERHGCPCGDAAPEPLAAPTPPEAPEPREALTYVPRRTVEVDESLPRQLTDSDVLGVLREHRVAIRNCLRAHQASTSNLEGEMKVKLLIPRSGRATRVSVSPARFRASVVGQCVAREVKTWRFPAFSGPWMPIDFPVTVRR